MEADPRLRYIGLEDNVVEFKFIKYEFCEHIICVVPNVCEHPMIEDVPSIPCFHDMRVTIVCYVCFKFYPVQLQCFQNVGYMTWCKGDPC